MKTITIEAKTKSGERGYVTVDCPQTLAEAVKLESHDGKNGEIEVLKGYLATKIIVWQRDARPTAVKTENGAPKPKKRMSALDRLAAAEEPVTVTEEPVSEPVSVESVQS